MKLIKPVKRPVFPMSARALQTSALVATVSFAVWTVREKILAQTVPQPVLKIATTNSTQFLLSITNAVASTNYEIYRTQLLGDTNSFPWELHIVGSIGQSNFTADMGIDFTGFFRASIGTDQDGDGAQDWLDANPTDPTIGILSITIDSPTNGSVLQ